MDISMPFQVRKGDKSFSTKFTFMWLFTSVNSHMPFQVRSVVESLLTNITLMHFFCGVNVLNKSFEMWIWWQSWIFSDVNSFMLFQVRRGVEALFTKFNPDVISSLMRLQITQLLESFFTKFAVKWFFSVVNSFFEVWIWRQNLALVQVFFTWILDWVGLIQGTFMSAQFTNIVEWLISLCSYFDLQISVKGFSLRYRINKDFVSNGVEKLFRSVALRVRNFSL